MQIDQDATSNAIPLDSKWEAYFIDRVAGWMIRCITHKEKACTCVYPDNNVWKKIIFLDRLMKL